jgi:hypothetical protein
VTATQKTARRLTILAAIWAVLFVAAVVGVAIWPDQPQQWLWLALSAFLTVGMGWEARHQRRRLRGDRADRTDRGDQRLNT